MSEIDPIQMLIRLKRHEQPPADFVEDFLGTFHQRQRAELLQQSARGLLWERVTTYFEDLMTPKWGWAFASIAVAGVLALSLRPGTHDQQFANAPAESGKPTASQGVVPASDERYLINAHFKGGLGDEFNKLPKSGSAFLPAGLRISDDVTNR
jgi:hypothetical protein